MRYLQNLINQGQTCHFATFIHYCLRSWGYTRHLVWKVFLRHALDHVSRQKSQQIRVACLVVLVYTGHREDHTVLYPLLREGLSAVDRCHLPPKIRNALMNSGGLTKLFFAAAVMLSSCPC